MQEYVKMNLREVENLDRDKTIFLMAVSPMEVHGPHLPLGTDVFVAEELQKRYAAELAKEYPAYTLVKLPPLYLGSDAVPASGSLSVPGPALKDTLVGLGRGLAKQGFRYLFLADNHGGPRHQLAIEVAARKLWKKHLFYMINPFGLVFRLMVQHDKDFMEKVGLEEGQVGDDPDSHAGTNETSLALATDPEMVAEDYREVPPSEPPPPSGMAMFLARVLGVFSEQVRKDLEHLANVLGWVGDPEMKTYMGFPAIAGPEAGEAMFAARLEVAMRLFRKALKGEPVEIRPMLWWAKFLYKLPE